MQQTPARHYRVYVITLKKSVLKDRRFVATNPEYRAGKPCVYVGMTGKDPQVRFEQHKMGYKSGRLAKRYAKNLRTDVIKAFGFRAQTYEAALKRERELANELRLRGWGVSQG